MKSQPQDLFISRRNALALIAGTGEELLSVSIDDPKNYTYRCVYCE